MADKSQQLVLDALTRLAGEPAGLPVFVSKSAAGIFPTNAAGKQAAQRCQYEGWLRSLRQETRGKATLEVCALSEKGLAYLLDQVNPRQVLEAFADSLENRRRELDDLVASARASQQTLTGLADLVRDVLQRLHDPAILKPGECNGQLPHTEDTVETTLLGELQTWHESGKLGDYPLPELYRSLRSVHAHVSIGGFHDGLRRLHEQQRIYLHPWTGPLYEIREPALALLIGHEIAYYASLRP